MKALNFPYIQPALTPEQKPVDILMLCAKYMASDVDSVDVDHVKSFLYKYTKYAMSISEPLQNESVKEMYRKLADVGKSGKITLSCLDELVNKVSS